MSIHKSKGHNEAYTKNDDKSWMRGQWLPINYLSNLNVAHAEKISWCINKPTQFS